VVIPKELRGKLNIGPGDKVLLVEEDGAIVIIPIPEDPISAFRGMLKEFRLVEELLETRKEEAAGEELRAGQLRGLGILPR